MTCIFCQDANMTWWETNGSRDVFKCIKCDAKAIIKQQSKYENKFIIEWDNGKEIKNGKL